MSKEREKNTPHTRFIKQSRMLPSFNDCSLRAFRKARGSNNFGMKIKNSFSKSES